MVPKKYFGWWRSKNSTGLYIPQLTTGPDDPQEFLPTNSSQLINIYAIIC